MIITGLPRNDRIDTRKFIEVPIESKEPKIGEPMVVKFDDATHQERIGAFQITAGQADNLGIEINSLAILGRQEVAWYASSCGLTVVCLAASKDLRACGK